MAKKIRGKEWYQLVAPGLFNKKKIGETLVGDPKEVVGRTVVKSLPELGGRPSKYYLRIKLKADQVKDKKIEMKYIGQKCLRDYISQMIRKGSSRIDNVVKVETKDGKKLVVKTIGISLKKTQTSTQESVRKKIGELIKKRIKKMDLNALVDSVIRDKFQVKLRKKVNKIYPLRKFEIRKIELLGQ